MNILFIEKYYLYAIIFVITVLIIWLVNKFFFNKRLKNKWLVIISLVATPILYIMIYWIAFFMIIPNGTRQIDFERSLWFENGFNKVEMVDDLVESKILINKTPEEIFQQLGKPDRRDSANSIYYYLGTESVGFGIFAISIQIELENNHSVSVIKLSERLD